jgi:hypothetical protein
MAKASINFSSNNFTDTELNVKAKTITDGIRSTPALAALLDQATAIETENNNYGGLLAQMDSGDKQVTAEKNVSRKTLEKLLNTTGLRVQDISGGDEVIIISSGYDLTKKAAPVGVLSQPVNVQVKAGSTIGTLDISWDVVPNAYSYEIRYTPTPKTSASVYNFTTSTKRKITIENLVSGQTYIVQVAGVGANSKRIWSVEVVSTYVP